MQRLDGTEMLLLLLTTMADPGAEAWITPYLSLPLSSFSIPLPHTLPFPIPFPPVLHIFFPVPMYCDTPQCLICE